MSEEITELFAAIVGFAEKSGVREITKLPGCWEFSPAEGWWIAVNGHREPMKCSRGPEVAPFRAYVEWNGFPAGIIGPHDGVLAAGSLANESALLAALGGVPSGREEP